MAKEEKGYWFSTENGTHVHAEEGESKEEAMGKKFKGFKKPGTMKPKQEKDETGLKVESRSMVNENQADSPDKLANKMEESHKKLHDAFKETAQEHAKNYNETDKKVIEMIKQGKTSDEIATVLEEEDTTGEFDYYNAIDYIDNLRDETELLEEESKSLDNDSEVEKQFQEITKSGNIGHVYGMLDRMRSDVDYILGSIKETRTNHPEWFANDDRKNDLKHLWWSNEPDKHFALMKKLYNSLKEKPEWLSMEDIENKEKELKDYIAGK